MNFEFFINEVERAYRVLSADDAEMQNRIDIYDWITRGYINEKEASKLTERNRQLYLETR